MRMNHGEEGKACSGCQAQTKALRKVLSEMNREELEAYCLGASLMYHAVCDIFPFMVEASQGVMSHNGLTDEEQETASRISADTVERVKRLVEEAN